MARNRRIPSTFRFWDRDGNSPTARELNTWLDVHLAEEPRPVDRLPLSEEDQTHLDQLKQTMDGIATRVAREDQAHLSTDQHDKEAIWRQIMTTTPIALSTSSGFTNRSNVPPVPHSPSGPRSFARPTRGFAALNAVLTAVLVIAIAGGAFYTGQRFRAESGNSENNGDSPGQLAALTQSASPETNTAPSTVTLPTAEDCTVTPLTVDQLIFMLETPDLASEQVLQAPAPYSQNPSSPVRIAGEVDQDVMDGIAAVQREWIACAIKDATLQRWALQDPGLTVEEVRLALPPFLTKEEIREFLEGIPDTGGVIGLTAYSSALTSGPIPLINSVPSMARCSINDDGQYPFVSTSQLWYNPDGKLLGEQSLLPDNPAYVPWQFIAGDMDGPWYVLHVGSFDFRQLQGASSNSLKPVR